MNKNALKGLYSRLAKAKGSDREIDVAILEVVLGMELLPQREWSGIRFWSKEDSSEAYPEGNEPNFTGNLRETLNLAQTLFRGRVIQLTCLGGKAYCSIELQEPRKVIVEQGPTEEIALLKAIVEALTLKRSKPHEDQNGTPGTAAQLLTRSRA